MCFILSLSIPRNIDSYINCDKLLSAFTLHFSLDCTRVAALTYKQSWNFHLGLSRLESPTNIPGVAGIPIIVTASVRGVIVLAMLRDKNKTTSYSVK